MSEQFGTEFREGSRRTQPPTGQIRGVARMRQRGPEDTSLWMALAGCGIVLSAIAAACAYTEQMRTRGVIGRIRERIREMSEE